MAHEREPSCRGPDRRAAAASTPPVAIPLCAGVEPTTKGRVRVHLRATVCDMVSKPHDVLATREVRKQLPALLDRFRNEGADAEPVVIGARRRPEAVVLSYERYLQLAGGRERVAAALDRQTQEAGARLDADAALELADSELHAMRRERAQGS